jgi:hypothetical protein
MNDMGIWSEVVGSGEEVNSNQLSAFLLFVVESVSVKTNTLATQY